jgi:hypothetical protein
VAIPKEEEPIYKELFEAVWDNNIATVKRLTTGNDGSNSDTTQYPLHIGVNDQNSQSLLHIACMRGHATMAALILKIADKQYALVADKDKKKKDRKEKSINNYNIPICKYNDNDNNNYVE